MITTVCVDVEGHRQMLLAMRYADPDSVHVCDIIVEACTAGAARFLAVRDEFAARRDALESDGLAYTLGVAPAVRRPMV